MVRLTSRASDLDVAVRNPKRVAMLSVHTSPLDQPGTGDAGGLNVYVVELAKRLAKRGTEVEIFTRATSPDRSGTVGLTDGITVHQLAAGRLERVNKNDLPGQLCTLTAGVLRVEASRPSNWFDVIHSHYWLSGQVGTVASERWNVPLVHSMHTLAHVKNRSLAADDTPEPAMRVLGEQELVDSGDGLIANTATEADDLIELYDADPHKISIVHPGVDLDVFRPGSKAVARAKHGIPHDALVMLFVGRIQPLKRPDIVIKTTAALVEADPALRARLITVICGGPSGAGMERIDQLRKLAASLGVTDLVRFVPPSGRAELAEWYRSADVVCVPSQSESFGLVAIEAQACGSPVIAADVGGLSTAVADDISGLLVPDHHIEHWRQALADVLHSAPLRDRLSRGARGHARNFSWDATAAEALQAYRDAELHRRARHLTQTARSSA